MIGVLAHTVVLATGLYLVGLGLASLLRPAATGAFLLGFATTIGKHFLEMSLRLLAGLALVIHSPQMLFPKAFGLFAWLVLVTTCILVLVPWQFHRRFAQRVVPVALRHLWLVGLVSLALGALFLAASLAGRGAGIVP